MSAIADLVAKLIAAGTPADVAAVVVTEAFAAGAEVRSGGIPVDHSAEKRRAYDRERKRLAAEIRRNSGGNPRNDDSALTTLEDKQDIKPEKKVRAKLSRGELLPPDAKPSAEHYSFGTDGGFSREWVDQQFEDMRIWARTNEHRAVARKSDWNLTFTGWLRRSAGDAKGRSNGHGTGANRTAQAAGPAQTSAGSILAGMGRLAARVAERQLAERQHGLDLADGDGPKRN